MAGVQVRLTGVKSVVTLIPILGFFGVRWQTAQRRHQGFSDAIRFFPAAS